MSRQESSLHVTRRRTLQLGAAGALVGLLPISAVAADGPAMAVPHQATGLKIGEVTEHSACVWVRLTQFAERLAGDEVALKALTGDKTGTADATSLPGACPAVAGEICVVYGVREDLSDGNVALWTPVTEAADGVLQVMLSNLPADSVIHLRVEARSPTGVVSPTVIRGRFRTAPEAKANAAITGVVLGCHLYDKRDHADGFATYPSVAALAPHFLVQTGDNVYYDRDLGPFATTAPLARWQWERMFSLPRHRALLSSVASYWEKDDHDTLKDDSWPGTTFGKLTFAEGQRIFRAQVPSGPLPYRTFRWGQHVQVWLMEGRDFRSPNTMADGPDKTIWGAEQLAWLQRTMLASDASWLILVSPTPIVGPDRKNKKDNHANDGFRHEGDAIKAWFAQHVAKRLVIINGDRHWQYHSVHPTLGLHEFSAGPTSNGLAEGSPGEDPTYHRFHRIGGGFLSFTASPEAATPVLTVRHHKVDGTVAYSFRFAH
ncbi:MAG: alkaline phosphatase D family protein [Planctomycetes bacterium]|nr:alkaline phosphatase D family protein [Planctomycetota bacterium]